MTNYFLFHNLIMSFIASFEDVKELINAIDNIKTKEDADKVYDMFLSNECFQNEYNIIGLYDIIYTSFRNNVKNYKELLYLGWRFMQKYNYFCNYIKYTILPLNCQYFVSYPNTEEVIKFENGFTLYNIKKDTIIKIVKDDNIIMVITILEDVETQDNDIKISFSKYGNIKISNIKVNVVINDINALTSPVDVSEFEENDIVSIIKEDNVDGLINFINTNLVDALGKEYKIDNSKYYCNIQHKLSLIDATLLYGAVRCFKYLYLNNCYHLTDNYFEEALIAGGNIEIFRILERDNRLLNTNNILREILYYHNMPLFIYWYNKYMATDDLKTIVDVMKTAIFMKDYNVVEYMKTNYGDYFNINDIFGIKDNEHINCHLNYSIEAYIYLGLDISKVSINAFPSSAIVCMLDKSMFDYD